MVVGGGYIGLEMGTVYAALGSKVSVVELTDGLLPGADRDLVRPLQKRLQGDFEAIYLNTKVASLVDKGDSIEVTFEVLWLWSLTMAATTGSGPSAQPTRQPVIE